MVFVAVRGTGPRNAQGEAMLAPEGSGALRRRPRTRARTVVAMTGRAYRTPLTSSGHERMLNLMAVPGVLDEAYEHLARTGPEFEGWLSNHGPMAAEALVRLGREGDVASWLLGYLKRLEPAPEARWKITREDWREALGDASRLGDWCALLIREVHAEPWEEVLARWWPRLLPGAAASATHGLIRTGHAVRALREHESRPRLDELGRALGYWAARWQPIPIPPTPRGVADAAPALGDLPARQLTGGVRTRLARLCEDSSWIGVLGEVRPITSPMDVPGALDALVDSAVACYGGWATASPIMLVHAATAPRAIRLALPALPEHLWPPSYDAAWAVAATLATIYRPSTAGSVSEEQPFSLDDVIERAVASGDEHVIKFTEVAVESHLRGNLAALASATRAATLIGAG